MFTDRAVFKQKRAEQTFAAESILKLADYTKQYKMVEIVLGKLFKVLNLFDNEVYMLISLVIKKISIFRKLSEIYILLG